MSTEWTKSLRVNHVELSSRRHFKLGAAAASCAISLHVKRLHLPVGSESISIGQRRRHRPNFTGPFAEPRILYIWWSMGGEGIQNIPNIAGYRKQDVECSQRHGPGASRARRCYAGDYTGVMA